MNKQLAKVATHWNSGTTRECEPGHRVRIPSALTTKASSHNITACCELILRVSCIRPVAALTILGRGLSCLIASSRRSSVPSGTGSHRAEARLVRHGGRGLLDTEPR